jgi:outer membrane protein assembly factor BamB
MLPGSVTGQRLKDIVESSDTQGGFVVQLGCANGELTYTLAGRSSYQVQVLDVDAVKVGSLRRQLKESRLYGRVTADVFDGEKLPYIDNLVNMIVIDGESDLSTDPEELKRVLSPLGVIVEVEDSGARRVYQKPWPDDIGEWTHYLCDASNNAVAPDRRVGPPKQLQWVAGPKWCRTHDHLASMSALVSAQGRIFYIMDEGPIAMAALAPQWMLIARDAFSGVLLWKRPIEEWEGHMRGFRSGPTELQRRLVAVGNRVFVTLGYGEPVAVLDAASGRTVHVYPQTKNALEMIVDDNRLFVLAGDRRPDNKARKGRSIDRINTWLHWSVYKQTPPEKKLIAIDLESNDTVWTKADSDVREILPMTMVSKGDTIYFQNYEKLTALDAETGEMKWSAGRPVNKRRPAWSVPTIVVAEGVVISADRSVTEPADGIPADDTSEKIWLVNSRGGHAPMGEMIAFSANDGRELWRAPCKEVYNAPVDILVVNGLVWSGKLVGRKEPGITEALDVRTGRVMFTRPQDQDFYRIIMGHHRCYRNKATTNYLLLGRDGTEYIDVETGELLDHHWMRGTCQYGIMPANGLTYVPPHSCACHIESKLNSFLALSSNPGLTKQRAPAVRLTKGEAYDAQAPASDEETDSWPTYRQNNRRSGKSGTKVDAEPTLLWRTDLDADLSQPVVADGRVFAACKETNTLHALDTQTGRKLWEYIAGAAIDSPPALLRGRAIFGCRDGWIYCLRVRDGKLIWRYLAAPEDLRIIADGKPESLWPVNGSVLVQDNVVYAAAGRTPYLAGGLRVCRLNAATGEALGTTSIQTRALPDILSSDGEHIFMRHLVLERDGSATRQTKPHLYSPAGFLDGDWWHRTYWLYADVMKSNYGGWPQMGKIRPAGRLLVVDKGNIYGYGRLNQYNHMGSHVGLGNTHNVLYSAPINQGIDENEKRIKSLLRWNNPDSGVVKSYWYRKVPVWVRAMVLSDSILFAAGPPDYIKKGRSEVDDPYRLATPDSLQKQQEALLGNRGGLLCSFSADDGAALNEIKLSSPVVWDGMAAADKKLFLCLMNGQLACYGEQ